MASKWDFSDSGLVGHYVSLTLMSKLVDKGVISVEDAIDVLDDALFQMEKWQSYYPEHERQYFELARSFLSAKLDAYRTIQKKPPD